MKAFWIAAGNGRTNIALRETAQPVAGEHQVLVRVHAAGLNRGELLHEPVAADQRATPAKPLGSEAAGEIVAVGRGGDQTRIGERVMGRARGAFAPYALMDAREAMTVPANLSWEQAAAIPLVFAVVYDMLVVQGHAAAGEWLLVTGVTSGVGVGSLQLGKVLGMTVMGTSRSAAKLARLRGQGLDLGLSATGPGFADQVLRATNGQGVDLVVNNVGGSVFPECVRALGYEGRLATVGYVDGVFTSEIDLAALHRRRLRLFGVSNKMRRVEQRLALLAGLKADVIPLFASGSIVPLIDSVYPFDELPAAVERMDANQHVGKIVVSVGA
ncbi:MAG: zinc-binding alcohol dehydrogenase [Candidimonas sp.]|nr:MAG: zinc-binding alcohol dehydrogenase [Candidimonas sp.]